MPLPGRRNPTGVRTRPTLPPFLGVPLTAIPPCAGHALAGWAGAGAGFGLSVLALELLTRGLR